ncbi:hypothetical protein ROHU_003153 [Labeo rohita]|uniref:Uncharacterized protein n=1 Tax=Labeo rohita TaxID=84645 RepID=A0A498NWY2_LABRO|nr:hypothetical protein ROHU_011159 [Labeo rohita]RXN36196.1 hypothetical protein ROHU_003153 [Labeo rohita]
MRDRMKGTPGIASRKRPDLSGTSQRGWLNKERVRPRVRSIILKRLSPTRGSSANAPASLINLIPTIRCPVTTLAAEKWAA